MTLDIDCHPHISQFIKASEALLAALGPQLFARQRSTRVLLAFGSAVARPKELYDLRFTADAAAATLSARGHAIFSRRFVWQPLLVCPLKRVSMTWRAGTTSRSDTPSEGPRRMHAGELQQLRHRVIRTLVAEAAASEEGPASAGGISWQSAPHGFYQKCVVQSLSHYAEKAGADAQQTNK